MASFKFKADGINDLQKELKRLQRAAKELDGTHEVPFSDLFTSGFMRKYTSFDSIDALLETGGFQAETSEEFDAIPEATLDKHIAASTKFRSWQEMLKTATEEYFSRKLGL